MRLVIVRAEWDDAAKVWVADGTNLEGLVTEADTLEALRARLALVVPDLLDEYGEQDPDVAIEVIAHSHDHSCRVEHGRSLPADATAARQWIRI